MSEHDHENEQDPEDVLRGLFGMPTKTEADRAKMQATAEIHEVYAYFDETDVLALKRMKTLMTSVINASNGASGAAMQAAFWQGFLTAKLEDHHAVCAACGVNHMEEFT